MLTWLGTKRYEVIKNKYLVRHVEVSYRGQCMELEFIALVKLNGRWVKRHVWTVYLYAMRTSILYEIVEFYLTNLVVIISYNTKNNSYESMELKQMPSAYWSEKNVIKGTWG